MDQKDIAVEIKTSNILGNPVTEGAKIFILEKNPKNDSAVKETPNPEKSIILLIYRNNK